MLTKSVPRCTNRTIWKQASGHAPEFLSYNPYKLHVGDLVFFSSHDDTLMYFKVVSNVSLTASDACVKVQRLFQAEEPMEIKCEKLLTDDKGLIFAVPSEFYSVKQKEGMVEFSDIARQLFDSALNKTCAPELSDEDWSVLLDSRNESPEETAMDVGTSHQASVSYQAAGTSEAPVENSLQSGPSGTMGSESNDESGDDAPVVKKRKKAKRKISDSEEEENVNFLVITAGIGDWVILMYEDAPYIGQVMQISESHGYQVKTLDSPQRNNWFVWSSEEEIWYTDVICVIDPPDLANSRGALKFAEKDYQKYTNILN